MSMQQIQAAIHLAKERLSKDSPEMRMVQSHLVQGSHIVAVGSVHNLSILRLCNLLSNQNNQYYTKQDLRNALQFCVNKTDNQLQAILKMPDPQYIRNQVTNIALVYAQMDRLGIDRINTAEVGNVEGILLRGCNPLRRSI